MAPEGSKRGYKSELRAERARATRDRIVRAAAELLGEDPTALTMPAVAKRARVSLPTVYRYFPDKAALRDAIAQHLRELMGVAGPPEPGLDGLLSRTRGAFERMEAQGPSMFNVLAASATPLPPENIAMREKGTAQNLRTELKGIRGKERERLVSAIAVMCSSAGALAFSRFGHAGAQGADLVEWVVRTLIAGTRAHQEDKSK